MKLTGAATKGLITGIAMILVSVAIYYTKGNFQNKLQYITYSIYVAGIVWTLMVFAKSTGHSNRFGEYFSQGFKCFIVVTLLMVIFTGIFLVLQPQLKLEMAVIYRTEMIEKGDYTKREVDEKVALATKSFVPSLVMGAVFGYLVIGAMVTAITSGFLMQKKRNVA